MAAPTALAPGGVSTMWEATVLPRQARPDRAAALGTAPPLFLIEARSLYDAGFQQGRLASQNIRGWLSSPEMTDLVNFTMADSIGRTALAQLVRDNTAVFPELVDEMRGVAAGAGVPMHDIWVATLITELEALQPSGRWRDGHCSDIFAGATGLPGLVHGHNEDWPGAVRDYFFFVAYRPAPGTTDVPRCAGLVYPGGLVGWAPTWNDRGLYQTVNTLFPTAVTAGGLGSAFVQRRALCGGGNGHRVGGAGSSLRRRLWPPPAEGLEGVIASLRMGGWASGASVNLVDLNQHRAVNVELHGTDASVYEVGIGLLSHHTSSPVGYPPLAMAAARVPSMDANYSHFNKYKHLQPRGALDPPRPSTAHRQARVDSLPAPRTAADVRARLSDTADREYPVFRPMTLASFVLDGWELSVWCCGDAPMSGAAATYRWDLRHFFDW